MRHLKGWRKLTLQIALLSLSMIVLSFLTETQLWHEYFNYKIPTGKCNHFNCGYGYSEKIIYSAHSHWNYRAYVYVITGVIYFIMSVARIVVSIDGNELNNTK